MRHKERTQQDVVVWFTQGVQHDMGVWHKDGIQHGIALWRIQRMRHNMGVWHAQQLQDNMGVWHAQQLQENMGVWHAQILRDNMQVWHVEGIQDNTGVCHVEGIQDNMGVWQTEGMRYSKAIWHGKGVWNTMGVWHGKESGISMECGIGRGYGMDVSCWILLSHQPQRVTGKTKHCFQMTHYNFCQGELQKTISQQLAHNSWHKHSLQQLHASQHGHYLHFTYSQLTEVSCLRRRCSRTISSEQIQLLWDNWSNQVHVWFSVMIHKTTFVFATSLYSPGTHHGNLHQSLQQSGQPIIFRGITWERVFSQLKQEKRGERVRNERSWMHRVGRN